MAHGSVISGSRAYEGRINTAKELLIDSLRELSGPIPLTELIRWI